MPNKDRNIPKRRFKEFENEDAWELRKLGELIDNLKGGVSITPNDYIENGYRTIPKGAVNDTGIADLSSCKNVSVDFFEKNYFSKTITGELITSLRDLVPSAPNLGRIVRIVGQFEEFIMPQGVYSLKTSENLLEDFLIAYSNCYIYRNVIQSEKNGSTQVHIRNGEFLNIKIQLPSLPEQKAIGTFFSTLDCQITLHQRKLDKLKHVKQAYLSEMFPAEGERVPKRRFPGFTDDWELRKLGEVADVFDGTHQTPRYTNQGVMFLSVEDINTLESEKYISSEDFEKEFKIFPEFNDVLMTRIGDIGTSNIVKTNDKIAYYVSLALIKPKKLESHFLNSIIQSKDFQNELWKRTLHIAFPKKINKGEISEVNLKFPTLPEQKAIGTFFSTLDQQITLHQRKLEKLKNLKKALLNELFV
ncbi:TPA: restriction endonuclease subunit S [Streptococcus suis]